MDWIQVLSIIGSLGAFMFWMVNKLDGDIKTLASRMDSQIISQNQRIDQLYTMFIDLLKDKNR